MSEPETPLISDPPPSNHYRIRKEVVALCAAAMVGWGVYLVHDWWTYMDWPPYAANGGSNKAVIDGMSCKKLHPIDVDEISKWNLNIDPKQTVDRRNFVTQPNCVGAGTYLFYEGSGTRQVFYVIDMEKKRRTAKFEITFDADERALK